MSVIPASAKSVDERIIAGWLETIVLSPWNIKLKAKLDSGAKTSSIHAENIQRFERDGKTWVRFDFSKKRKTKTLRETIEVPLLRDVRIKRHNLPSITRPAVELALCIDGHYYTAQFTLADRGKFNYPVLLGRRFLKNKVLIDPGETFMHTSKEAAKTCQRLDVQAKSE